jgi:hypothetical protein
MAKSDFVLLVLMVMDHASRTAAQSPKKYAERIFQFIGVKIQDESTFYCPVKHMTTHVRDLCLYVSYSRRSRDASRDNCVRKSQRLAELDSMDTWHALKSHLHREDYQSSDAYAIKIFHMGLLRFNAKLNAHVWNHTGARLDNNTLCNPGFKLTTSEKCVELFVDDRFNVSFKCLRLVDCNRKSLYSICEWRGSTIPNFDKHLVAELIKSYMGIVGVLLVYAFLLGLICTIHNCRTRNQIRQLIERHTDKDKCYPEQAAM